MPSKCTKGLHKRYTSFQNGYTNGTLAIQQPQMVTQWGHNGGGALSMLLGHRVGPERLRF